MFTSINICQNNLLRAEDGFFEGRTDDLVHCVVCFASQLLILRKVDKLRPINGGLQITLGQFSQKSINIILQFISLNFQHPTPQRNIFASSALDPAFLKNYLFFIRRLFSWLYFRLASFLTFLTFLYQLRMFHFDVCLVMLFISEKFHTFLA